MLNQRTFSEVFSEIQIEKENQNRSYEWESLLEPAWITQVMAELGSLQIKSHTLSRQRQYPKPASPRPSRIAHILTDEQQLAFDLLHKYQIHSFSPAFNKQELKSAYRLALLKTHPDQGGNAETFHQVKKSYEILSSLDK
jgi:hypothetical protein